jgi:DNA-binding beta-propeller fold protein YncE
MVQCVLGGWRSAAVKALAVLALVTVTVPAFAGKQKKASTTEPPWPELLLDGGRKLTYVQSIASQRDIRTKRGFWTKLTDVVLGDPEFNDLIRPYSVAVDSKGRMIVTDPGLRGVHIFDLSQRKYKFLDRQEKSKDPMIEPQCVAVDGKDNIYITDSKAGKVFLFEANGKYRGAFGSIKGEGFFKRPTGIAIDAVTQNIFVTDTLRDKVFILGQDGKVIKSFGQHGGRDGEFNLPTEIHIKGDLVAVVDSMNFRVELFDRDGNFKSTIGTAGEAGGEIYRPKGIAIDSEEHVYLVEGEAGQVKVFDREGQLLYNFGNGTGFGQFLLPSGLFIDRSDRVFVVDSYNRRVQVFQYHALKSSATGAAR